MDNLNLTEALKLTLLESISNSSYLIDSLNELKAQFEEIIDDFEEKEIMREMEQLLKDADSGEEFYMVYTDTLSGWTSYGSYSHEITSLIPFIKDGNAWKKKGSRETNHDIVLAILYNNGDVYNKQDAEKIKSIKEKDDKSIHRDIINTKTDGAGHGIEGVTIANRIDYKNKKEEDLKEAKKDFSDEKEVRSCIRFVNSIVTTVLGKDAKSTIYEVASEANVLNNNKVLEINIIIRELKGADLISINDEITRIINERTTDDDLIKGCRVNIGHIKQKGKIYTTIQVFLMTY